LERIFSDMGHIDACLAILRRLIANGAEAGIPLAQKAIDEYCDATPAPARKSGLRFLQQDILKQREACRFYLPHDLMFGRTFRTCERQLKA
jgi:hypothetical protein